MSTDKQEWHIREVFVAQYLHGAKGDFERVVEGDFVIAQAQSSATLGGFARLFCQRDQSFNDSGGFNRAILVFADRGFEQFGE